MNIPYLPDCPVFVFDGKNNFENWYQQMNFFNVVRLWSIIDEGFVETAEGTTLTGEAATQLEKNMQLNYKAFYYLNSKVRLHVYNKYLHAKSTKEAWTILVKSYRRAADVKREKLQELWRQYKLPQMKPTESVKEFFTRIIKIVNDMKVNGEVLEDAKVVEKILQSLRLEFHIKKTVIEATQDLNTLRVDDLEDELVAYEMSLNQQTHEIVDEALQTKDEPKDKEESSNLAEIN
ncbi:uncharacterized protein LOC132614321 [Lycium barbarum]|uniref:uncharacterized protein LOC132614321 n=1 Tax=Lycium barbarum TaxID=112863 RepID=UPI00293F1166|nr:uncharacterized protein LOC132614321 [Lycium barbarum]